MSLLAAGLSPALSAQRSPYPAVRSSETVDSYHGARVRDPFQWLENLTSDETSAFVRAQNAVTEQWIEAHVQRRDWQRRLTDLWNYSKTGLPTRLSSGVLFYRRNSGLQRQSVLVARSSPETPTRTILDPNTLWPDGNTALAQTVVAPDGRHVAYSASKGGADWEEVRIKRVRTGEDLSDVVRWVRFSTISWTRDANGFFYSRFPARSDAELLSATLEGHSLYYHKLGTDQADDVLVYARPDLPRWFIYGTVSEDGRYLWISLSAGATVQNRLYVLDLVTPTAPVVTGRPTPIVEADDGAYHIIGNEKERVFVHTDLKAPNGRVVAFDLRNPERGTWRTVVPEGPQPISEVSMTRAALVVHRLADVASRLQLFALDGKSLGTVRLPGVGMVSGISASRDITSFFYAFASPTAPSTIYRYEARTQRSRAFEAPTLSFDPTQFETVRAFATSTDGTKVPVFITARRGAPRNGTAPAMLYAYGGFGIAMGPFFSPAAIAWMEAGGVSAIASLRGGSEYGETWHVAGMRERKQNVFDDFYAAAELLVRDRWADPSKIGISGGSNGGLLVGAAMTQHPDRFAVALPAVGVLDMLRYHRFTGGAAWTDEYGSADDADAFAYLRAYSPLHNVKPGTCYPATLITTADHDDRVVPSHSYKFAATVQAAQGCDRPVLLRVEAQGSHGYRPTDRQINEAADVWGFAAAVVGLTLSSTRD